MPQCNPLHGLHCAQPPCEAVPVTLGASQRIQPEVAGPVTSSASLEGRRPHRLGRILRGLP